MAFAARALGRLGDEEADERFARAAGHHCLATVGGTEARDDVRDRLPLVIVRRPALRWLGNEPTSTLAATRGFSPAAEQAPRGASLGSPGSSEGLSDEGVLRLTPYLTKEFKR